MGKSEALAGPEPRIDEIADRIYRICTFVGPDAIPPRGYTFNQFLIDADEPLLYHTGMRHLFSQVSATVDRIVGLDRLRWIAFSHVESDECGAMNDFLAACPHAQVIHGATGVNVSLTDLADRPPRTWALARSCRSATTLSAAAPCSWTPLTCPTTGKRRSSSSRRPGRCSPVILAPSSVTHRLSLT